MAHFVDGTIYAGFFIFIRSYGRYSDIELLNRFDLSTYRLAKLPTRHQHYAILANDGEWTMIADDWYYTLWHMPSIRSEIAQLGVARKLTLEIGIDTK